MGAEPFHFGRPKVALEFWRTLVRSAVRKNTTPFYIFSVEPIYQSLVQLNSLQRGLPVRIRQWLSCKTQPVRPLLHWWRAREGGIEVVSHFELLAALKEGFPPERILVNGPAKQHWLKQHSIAGLRVNFDSLAEIPGLLPMARKLNWSLGVRCHTQEEHDPEHPDSPTQFGMERCEAILALATLRKASVRTETVHFHLRTNVQTPSVYERALLEVADICRQAGFQPKYVDCGGGLPAPYVLTHSGRRYDAKFDLRQLAAVYQRSLPKFPEMQELWLENGRFLTARSGVLVVRILEAKERKGLRQLICDGGRTLHALVATWENHQIISLDEQTGPPRLTVVTGPTCMAFDRLARRPLPASLEAGDYLIWLDAGAYHIPWETHFSHGLPKVFWHENGELKLGRKAETFESWWNRWEEG